MQEKTHPTPPHSCLKHFTAIKWMSKNAYACLNKSSRKSSTKECTCTLKTIQPFKRHYVFARNGGLTMRCKIRELTWNDHDLKTLRQVQHPDLAATTGIQEKHSETIAAKVKGHKLE